MSFKVFGLLLATFTGVGIFSPPQLRAPRKVTFQVVEMAGDGVVLARVTPTPLMIAASDKPLALGDSLTCTLENEYLDCGEAIVHPLGFVIRANAPDLRVQQADPEQRSQ